MQRDLAGFGSLANQKCPTTKDQRKKILANSSFLNIFVDYKKVPQKTSAQSYTFSEKQSRKRKRKHQSAQSSSIVKQTQSLSVPDFCYSEFKFRCHQSFQYKQADFQPFGTELIELNQQMEGSKSDI